jgi:type VI secretion system protein ImpB
MTSASVAPRERVNIIYQAATGDAREEKELPFKLLVLGDFSGRRAAIPVEERRPAPIAKESFDEVLAAHEVVIEARVPDRISAKPDSELELRLPIRRLADFAPEALVRSVPQLARLLALREALSALKGPLGNSPAFRRRIQELLADANARPALLDEIRSANA